MQFRTLGRSLAAVAFVGTMAAAPVAAQAQKDIVGTAVAAGQFKTLAALLTEAGLIETLQGMGPFTVFAPNDAAFAKVPADAVAGLKADKAALTRVLTYHVVPGKIMAADLAKLADKDGYIKTKTVSGEEIVIHLAGTKVHVGPGMASNVIAADIAASNGVIHVVDAVIMPPAKK